MAATIRTKAKTKLSIGDMAIYAAEAEECRRSFRAFVKAAWKVLEPSTELQWNWHMDALCEHLQAVMDGQIHRLIINIGPGHSKSTIISQSFPAWVWTRKPETRMLCASTDLALAIRDNRNCRYLIESEWYRACYGREFHLNDTAYDMSADQNMKSYFANDRQGYRQALSVCGKGIGKRGDLMIIDDPHDPREGDIEREKVLEWYAQTWYSRLNDQENGAMITVGQRIHDNDLCGYLLKLGGSEHLSLPEEFEPSRRCVTSIGWCDPRDKDGELLWPEKFAPSVIVKLKENLGSLGYAAQYQQSPVPATGGQFKEKWFRYFGIKDDNYTLETPEGLRHIAIKDCWRFSVVDLAVSTKQSADWTVIQTYDVTPANELLLIDQIRGRFDNPEQQRIIRATYFRLKPQFVQIEAVAYQLALIQQLRDEPVEDENGQRYSIPVREYKPVRDKVARASAPALLMENGKFYFLKTLSDLHIIKTEHLQFPKGTNDDIVDCSSQAAEVIFVPRGPVMWSPDDDLSTKKTIETAPTPEGVMNTMLEIDDPEPDWPVSPDEGFAIEWEVR